MRIFVPGDAAACAVGADAVAAAVGEDVVRNGSRGLFELEPLLEIGTESGRIGFARAKASSEPPAQAAPATAQSSRRVSTLFTPVQTVRRAFCSCCLSGVPLWATPYSG